MKTFKLHELVEIFENNATNKQSVLIELIVPYKKQLLTYFKEFYLQDPILVITSVFNSCSYGFIVPADNYQESICDYLNDYDCMNEENENFAEWETINSNSIFLENL